MSAASFIINRHMFRQRYQSALSQNLPAHLPGASDAAQYEANRAAQNRARATALGQRKAPSGPKPGSQPAELARQGLRSPDRTLLERYFRERAARGGDRSTVLTQLYGLPEDQNVASRALQSFNNRLGGATVLGRR